MFFQEYIMLLTSVDTFILPTLQGANFRDLPGVVVGADNVARRDPNGEQMLLPSGKPMVRCLSLFSTGIVLIVIIIINILGASTKRVIS